MKEKETIIELVSNGQTAEALDKLLSMDLPPKDRSIVIQINASFKNFQRDVINGILTFEQETTERNRINGRLIRFLNEEGDGEDFLKPEKKSIEIILDGNFEMFDKKIFTAIVAAFLDVSKNSIRVLQVYEGSIRVIIELPTEEAEKLIFMFAESGENLSLLEKSLSDNSIANKILKIAVYKHFLNDESEQALVAPIEEKRERKIWKYIAGAGIVFGILGGIAEFSGYNIKDVLFNSSEDETFTLTVFVHGKKGTDDRILKSGQVLLGLRGTEMAGTINEKGEATFKEISSIFKGKRVPIRIDHPQPYRSTHPDSLYLLEASAAIYVEVALEGTDRIFGKVMDFETEQWLDSVRVSVENSATYTDQFGWFELEIPENKQRKFQRVSFFKKGYKIGELDSIPVHTQQEINISLRKSTKR